MRGIRKSIKAYEIIALITLPILGILPILGLWQSFGLSDLNFTASTREFLITTPYWKLFWTAFAGSLLVVFAGIAMALPFSLLTGWALYAQNLREPDLATTAVVDFLKTTPAVILGFWAADFLLLKLDLPKTLGLGSLVIAIVYYPRLTIDVVRVLSRTPKEVIAAATALGAPATVFIRQIATRDLLQPLARATVYNFVRATGDITIFICLGAYVTVSVAPIEPSSPLHMLSVQIFHWSYRHYAGLATILSFVCAGFIVLAGLSALWTGPMMNVKSTTKARTHNLPDQLKGKS